MEGPRAYDLGQVLLCKADLKVTIDPPPDLVRQANERPRQAKLDWRRTYVANPGGQLCYLVHHHLLYVLT
jgi:hypothetical protein